MPKQVSAETVSSEGLAALTENWVTGREWGRLCVVLKGLSEKPLEPRLCSHAAQGAGWRGVRAQGREPGLLTSPPCVCISLAARWACFLRSSRQLRPAPALAALTTHPVFVAC